MDVALDKSESFHLPINLICLSLAIIFRGLLGMRRRHRVIGFRQRAC